MTRVIVRIEHPYYPHLTPALISYADLELQTKNYREAERLARRSLEISEAKLGRENMDWANSAPVLGRALVDQSRLQEADSLYVIAVPVLERVSGDQSLNYGSALRLYAQSRCQQFVHQSVPRRHQDVSECYAWKHKRRPVLLTSAIATWQWRFPDFSFGGQHRR